jgi:hypothetical protein
VAHTLQWLHQKIKKERMASKAFAALVVLLLLASSEHGRATLISGRPPVSSLPHPSSTAGDPGQARSMNAMSGASATTTLHHSRTGNGAQHTYEYLISFLLN